MMRQVAGAFMQYEKGRGAKETGKKIPCRVCEGGGRVPSRLPGRTRLCPECHGTGRVTPIKRDLLLMKKGRAKNLRLVRVGKGYPASLSP